MYRSARYIYTYPEWFRWVLYSTHSSSSCRIGDGCDIFEPGTACSRWWIVIWWKRGRDLRDPERSHVWWLMAVVPYPHVWIPCGYRVVTVVLTVWLHRVDTVWLPCGYRVDTIKVSFGQDSLRLPFATWNFYCSSTRFGVRSGQRPKAKARGERESERETRERENVVNVSPSS